MAEKFPDRIKRVLNSSRHGRIGIREFKKQFPDLTAQIRKDRDSVFLHDWGRSFNFDEHEQQKIVDPKLLSTIGRIANVEIRQGNSYHAGLIHTYGYLLSLLPTRFGFKRERWTTGVIDSGFETSERCFSPHPENGTLLSNITYFLTKISMGRQPFSNAETPRSLLNYRYKQLVVTRICETCRYNLGDGKKKALTFITDLVDFQKTVNGNSSLVIYSTLIDKSHTLITCFPTSSNSKKELLAIAKNNSTPIVSRFNLALNGFPKSGVIGKRTVESLKL